MVVLVCLLAVGSVSRASAGGFTVAWDPNPEADIVAYRVHVGVSSGTYVQTHEVSRVTTSLYFAEVIDGQQYCFAVSALNEAGFESPLSSEVCSGAVGAGGAIGSSLAIASLVASLPSPQVAGRSITFTAAPSGGVAPYTFKWMVSAGNGKWQVLRDWAEGASSQTWSGSKPGNYQIRVWVHDSGAEAAHASGTVDFRIAKK